MSARGRLRREKACHAAKPRAGSPSQLSPSTVKAASARDNVWITIVSTGVGHGTATRKNRTGKEKCFIHVQPPMKNTAAKVSAAMSSVMAQLTKRQPGFAS